jgi:hypothetical protein
MVGGMFSTNQSFLHFQILQDIKMVICIAPLNIQLLSDSIYSSLRAVYSRSLDPNASPAILCNVASEQQIVNRLIHL